jgi:hypothetical protein
MGATRLTSRPRSLLKTLLAIGTLGALHLACSLIHAPVRAVPPTSDIPLIILAMPETLRLGETGSFVVKTQPGNVCGGAIGYWDEAHQWTSVELLEVEADRAGECQWEWTVPPNASAGRAEVRVGVRQQSTSTMLIPKRFCIEACPP